MARVNNLTAFLTDVATAIKTKKGDNTAISAVDFDTEIINLPSPGIYQNKQVNITTNGNYIIAPDDTYDAMEQVVLNVEVAGKEDLDNVLNAQDQKITELEKALENKAAGGKVKLNVFAQTTEPEEKDGIWLETDKSFDKVHFDNNVKRITVEGWDTTKTYPTLTTSGNAEPFPATMIEECVYVFVDNKIYRYNCLTNNVEEIKTISINVSSKKSSACTDGKDIYLFIVVDTYINIYKYSVEENEFGLLLNTWKQSSFGISAVYANGNIYYNNYNDKYLNKYDIINNTVSQINTALVKPFAFDYTKQMCAVGDNIYLFSNGRYNKESYVFDTKTEIITQIKDIPQISGNLGVFAVNNYIYLMDNSLYTNYKYDMLTDTYSAIPSLRSKFPNANATYFVLCGYKDMIIAVYTGTKAVGFANYALTYDSVYDYEDNSVVVWDGFGKYKTQLTKSADNQEGKIQTLFYDAYHYTVENGLDNTIPTYYGDGTQWVKFKN